MIVEGIAAILGAGGASVIAAAISWIRNRRKDSADANRVNIDAALAVQAQSIEYVKHMMGPLEKRLRDADTEVDKLRKSVRVLSAEVDKAIRRAEMAESVLRFNHLPVPPA